MNNKTKTRSLRVAIIAIALLLCFALAVGVTSALYQARRQATGTLNMDKGIVIDYKGFNKGDENIWQRETTTSFKLFEETNAQPGQEISVYPSGIRANVDSINFYARLKLEYIFYNVANGVETKVDLSNPKSLIKTSNDFFASNWVPSTDGYYYFGENTTLNQFSKDNQNFENLFANGVKFIIEGANFEGETAGEGGGFVVNGTSINKIVVYLTLETLQGDATAEQAKDLGWEIIAVDRYPFTFSLNNAKQTATITGAIDDPIELDIPNKLLINNQEYDTISIGEGAFKDCLSLRNIKISDGVTSIDNKAFENCLSLKSIEIPTSVKSIGNETFKNCWKLTSITIPEGVDSMGDEIFENCKNLESISIPESITSIGKMAFEGCDSLNSRKTEKNGIEYLGNEKNEYVVAWRAGRYDEGDAIKVNENCKITYQCFGEIWNNCKIELPEGLISIGYATFSNSQLTEITIPNSVKNIGDQAFFSCYNLTSIEIPDSVKSIGEYAFSSCRGLTSIVIPNSVTSIGGSAFSGCSGLTSIEIPDSVTSIGEGAFYGCGGLTSITIPNSVTSIGVGAFNYCQQLKSITIGNGVTSIGDYTFNGCRILETVIIPNSITSIGKCAFCDCEKLTSITSLEGVTSIGNSAFEGCETLESITSLEGVTSIGNSAFEGCMSLTSITIPSSVTSIGENAFYDCKSLTSIEIQKGITSIGEKAFYGCEKLTSITSLEGVTSIGNGAFEGCKSLTSITIPSSVQSIGNHAFSNCYALAEVYDLSNLNITAGSTDNGDVGYYAKVVHKNINAPKRIVEENGIAYYVEKEGSSIIKKIALVLRDKTSTSATIADNCTEINQYAFADCTNLTSIEIPGSVTSIGEGVFGGCENLNSNIIENGIKYLGSATNPYLVAYGVLDKTKDSYSINAGCKIIYDSCFNYCTNLTEITIPNSVTSIGANAFSRCSGLTSITIPGSVTSIGVGAFSGCEKLTSISIPSSVTSIGGSAFSGCKSLTSIDIPDSVTSIGGNAFSSCGLTSIKIPSSVTSIGENTFQYCSSLTSIDIPDGVTTIGDYAFQNCTSLTSITIPSSVTSIGNGAFDYCTNLTEITIPSSVTSIGDYAFSSCKSLTSITIPDSVTYIGLEAFSHCPNLKSMTIGKGITGIKAFDYWLPSSVEQITISEQNPEFASDGSSIFVKKEGNVLELNKFIAKSGEYVIPSKLILNNVNWNVTSIRDHSFWKCTSLTSIEIPGSVTSIAFYAFSECTSLKSVTIGKGVTSIGQSAFSGCSSLESVTIPDSVKIIEYAAFSSCSSLKSVTIGKGVTSIGGYAFNVCTKLTSITIPDNVTSIESNAFRGCSSLKSVIWNVSYDLDGVDAIGPELSFYETNNIYRSEKDSVVGPAPTNIEEGFIFYGWTDGTTIYQPGDEITFNLGNRRLRAVWSICRITFDANGGEGSIDPIIVPKGSSIFLPSLSNFTKEGYVPLCWSLDKNLITEDYLEGKSFTPTKNTTLYVYWGINDNNLTTGITNLEFDLNGGKGKIPFEGIFNSIDTITLPQATSLIKEGYNFICWKIYIEEREEGTGKYVKKGKYFDVGEKIRFGDCESPIIAQWAKTYKKTINFDLKGGEGSIPPSFEVWGQTSFDILKVSLTKEGYTFLGWAWQSNATKPDYINGEINNIFLEKDTNDSTTLYAVWKRTFIVSFDANGGTGDVPTDISILKDEKFNIPEVTLTKEGYTFLGWSFNQNPIWDGIDYLNGAKNCVYSPTTNKTLYAVWGNTVTYEFDLNNGTGTTPNAISANYGETITVPNSNDFSRTGYRFLGWSRTSTSSSPEWWNGYQEFTVKGISGTITMYAVWEVLTDQVYVGSLTQAELDAVQALWNGHTSRSELTNDSLLNSMSNNKLHSRFSILGYLNNTSLEYGTSGDSYYGIGYGTRYFRLSTNSYTFEFENSLPTGWMLVNWRYEVKASGDVTIVNGRAQAIVDYTYAGFENSSSEERLMIIFVLPNQPAEGESVSVSISGLPGNALEALFNGSGSESLGNLLKSGIRIEIYNAEGNLLWLGKPNENNNGFVPYRFATGTYKIRFYTTNVNGVAFVNNDNETEVTGMNISEITKGDGYSEFTINYTFAEGNPNLAIIFKMADVSDLTKLERMDVSSDFCGPYNIVGNWLKGMFANMGVAFTDMTADEIKYAGYCGMLIKEYFNGSICYLPSFSIYTSDGKIIDNCENMALIAGVEYTIKFAEEVKEVMFYSRSVNSITNITYNEATGTWDATFSVSESTMLMFLTADLDLSQYEELPAYDAATDYSRYLAMH